MRRTRAREISICTKKTGRASDNESTSVSDFYLHRKFPVDLVAMSPAFINGPSSSAFFYETYSSAPPGDYISIFSS